MYWLTGLLGISSILAPFLLGYESNPSAFWASLIVGGTLIIDSVFEWISQDTEKWEYWIMAIIGFVALFAPFIFSFSASVSALWTLSIVGFLSVIIAGTKLFIGGDKKELRY